MKERENFGTRLGMLMAMVGSAVGLGNIWRFPFLVGEYGGAAFIFVYIICVFVLSLPIMFSEFIIGRRSKANAFRAYRKLAPGTGWSLVGLLTVAIPLIILSYYNVIGGWSLEYLFKACTLSFTSGADASALSSMFSDFISSAWMPVVCLLVFFLCTAVVVFFGVKSGIEKFGKIMMPVLFFVILAISIWVMMLPGASAGVKYLFMPDFSKITPQVCVAAMGQAFYSLSLGAGTIITYASYVKKEENICTTSIKISLMDLLFAILASSAIMPAAFAYGINPGQGPSLIFETLPFIFSQMPLGAPVAILFFASVFVAALTSTLSLMEVGTAFLVEERKMSRKKACAILFVAVSLVGVICSLSFGPLSGVKIFGKTIFETFDSVSATVLMPLAGLLACIFVGWKMPKTDTFDEFTNGGMEKSNVRLYSLVRFLIRFVAPIGIIVITVANLFF